MELKGKIALITGSTRGIGLATAKVFIREGAKVIIHGTQPARAREVADTIGETAQYLSVAGDMSLHEDVKHIFERIVNHHKRLDILVNNAGMPGDIRSFLDVTPDDWQRMIAVNLTGVYYCCREALKIMVPQKYGKIVNISSRAGETGTNIFGHCSDYSTAKAGVIALTRSLAKEFIPIGINVNAVAPGPIATDMVPAENRGKISSKIPAGRVGEAWEVAEAILYLVRDASRFVVGEVLDINGGARLV
jgi:3-oxoacyl-[acyl-carrier protein] reductase